MARSDRGRWAWTVGVGLLATGLLPGCAELLMQNAAHDRATTDLSCGYDQIAVTPLGGSAYRADGCGRRVTYACATGNETTTSCIREAPAALTVTTTTGAPAVAPANGAPPPSPPPPPEDPTLQPLKAELRAAIDEHRADVLACAGVERVAVAGQAAPDGAVRVSLQGPLAGTPQEECVKEVFAKLRARPSPRGFTVVHLVR